MKIGLLGYGKMGKLCEEIALSRGHTIVGTITSKTEKSAAQRTIDNSDVLIDFSHPECAVDNIIAAANHKKNIVVGTTGWYEHLDKITPHITAAKIGCIYAPNFSTGVALFNTLLKRAAQLFSQEQGYDAAEVEIHHNKKLDAPSGTAKALATTIEKERNGRIPITSVRVGHVPGTHTLIFDGPHETITLTHTAHNRSGFAEGAVNAAEWIKTKSGIFTFKDMLA